MHLIYDRTKKPVFGDVVAACARDPGSAVAAPRAAAVALRPILAGPCRAGVVEHQLMARHKRHAKQKPTASTRLSSRVCVHGSPPAAVAVVVSVAVGSALAAG